MIKLIFLPLLVLVYRFTDRYQRLVRLRPHTAMLLLLFLLLPRPALAQSDGLRIQQLRVQVMPEFDDPRVLVIIQGRLAETAVFPQEVTFRLPTGAQINQMATIDIVTGQTTGQPYDTRPDPADARWQLVTYTVENAHFFYEYYDDPLAWQNLDGDEPRAFDYTFSTILPIDRLLIEVQQPLESVDFQLAPAVSPSRIDDLFGFNYYQVEMGSLVAGESKSVSVAYTKDDWEPSLSRDQVMTMQNEISGQNTPIIAGESGPLPAGHPDIAGGSPLSVPDWLLAFLGGALLAGLLVAAVLFIRSRQQLQPAASSAGSSRTAGRFCIYCGTGLKSSAHFCHGCGAAAHQAQGE